MNKSEAIAQYGERVVEKAREMYETDFGKVLFIDDVSCLEDYPLEVSDPDELVGYLIRAQLANRQRQ